MAINRFRRVMYQPQADIPQYFKQEFIPDLTGADQLLAGYQAMYDGMEDITVPKHIQEDTEELQKEYLAPLKKMREGVVDAFSSGSTTNGLRSLRDMERFIKEATQPGGIYHGFESRYAERVSQREDLTKMLSEKERMDMAPFLESRLGYRPFRGDDGSIQSLGPASYSMVLKAGELDKWINEQLPNIKASLMQEPGIANKYQLDNYNTLWEMREAMGVDFNKVVGVLASRIPSQYKDAFRQEYMMARAYNPDLPELDEGTDPSAILEYDENGMPVRDKNGNYKIANTPLGKVIQGAAFGYQHIDPKSQYIKTTDDVGVARAKKLMEDEMNRQATLRTAVFDTGIALPKVEFKDGKVGIPVINQKDRKSGYLGAQYASISQDGPIDLSSMVYQDPKNYFNSDEFRDQNPMGADVWDLIKDKAEAEGWSNKHIEHEFSRIYKDVEAQMRTEDFVYEAYMDPNKISERRDVIVGTKASAGQITAGGLYVMEPGKPPRAISYETFKREYTKDVPSGVNSQEYINKSMLPLGQIKPGQNNLPSGEVLSYTTPKHGTVTIIASHLPVEQLEKDMPQFSISQPAFDNNIKESEIVSIPVNVSDQASDEVKNFAGTLRQGIYSTGTTRWEIDDVTDAIRYWEKVRIDQGVFLQGRQQIEYNKLLEKRKDLIANPQKNAFRGRHSIIFNDRSEPLMMIDENSTPGYPMYRQMTNKDLNNFLNEIDQ